MKKAITFIVLAAFTVQAYGQDITVPVRTATFKHNRAMYQCYSILLGAISYAKKSGGSAADIGTFMGDLFKDGWKKEEGYKGFMRGTVGNFESFRRKKIRPSKSLSRMKTKFPLNGK